MLTHFLDLPHEVTERIALLLTLDPDNIYGPPSCLLPLLLTCRRLNDHLSPTKNTHFASRLFRSRFDYNAIRRRQPRLLLPTRTIARQLVRYCEALRVIRTGDIYREQAVDSLWTAFLMLIENDGRNGVQLRDWANAYDFAHRWAFERLLGTGPNGSKTWPIDCNENGLVLWILWMLTDESILANETVPDRQRLIDTILPYVVMSYRYPSFHCPPNHFTTPVPELHVLFPTLPANPQHDAMRRPTHPFPYSLITAHGPYPLYLNPNNITVINWWGIDISFSQIPCGLAATLIYFSRRDKILPVPGLPLNRADAIARGRDGLTTEDIKELASYRGTVLPPRLTWESATSTPIGPFTENAVSSVAPYTSALNPHDDRWNSASWDIDWVRWTNCLDPRRESIGLGACIPYLSSRPGLAGLREARLLRPRRECYDIGSMAGLWQGKLMLQGEDRHVALLSNPIRDPAFGEEWLQMYSFPVMMRLREYHCISPDETVPKGHAKDGHNPRGPNITQVPTGATRVSRLPGFDDGAQNAWFPWRMAYKGQNSNSDVLTIQSENQQYEYYKHTSARPSSLAHSSKTCTSCLVKQYRLEEKERQRKERMVTDAEIETMALSHEHLFGSIGLGMNKRRPLVNENGSPIWDDGTRPESLEPDEEDECTGVTDVVFIGETDPHHSEAWHPYYFYGRLRRYDGLIGILRLAPTPAFGAMFFHGYLVGSRNFVGTWRMAATEMGVPAWMNAFSMSKREDD